MDGSIVEDEIERCGVSSCSVQIVWAVAFHGVDYQLCCGFTSMNRPLPTAIFSANIVTLSMFRNGDILTCYYDIG